VASTGQQVARWFDDLVGLCAATAEVPT